MRTKIIATVGPASGDRKILRELALAGVSIFRLNFAHGTAGDFAESIRAIRALETELGTPLTILQDLAGPKPRLGTLREASLAVTEGMRLLLGPAEAPPHGDLPRLPFAHADILQRLAVGDRLALADGGLQFTVCQRGSDGSVLLRADNAGIVSSRKSLVLPGEHDWPGTLTDKDKTDLTAGLRLGVDAVAVSCVRSAADVREVRQYLAAGGRPVPLVVKLERRDALERLDDILPLADSIMVARGALAMDYPLPQLPTLQKRIIAACNRQAKPVIVATQMLLSMIGNPAPTRAETTDAANAVLDGADCVMLSEETALGRYPLESVRYMRRITDTAEDLLDGRPHQSIPAEDTGVPGFLAYSACRLAEQAQAQGIVAHTLSGASARLLSSCRPLRPIHALTPDIAVCRALNFSWGVHPVLMPALPGESHLRRSQRFIAESPLIASGRCVVITAGQQRGAPSPAGGVNLIKVYWK